jgi:hypothetical protein
MTKDHITEFFLYKKNLNIYSRATVSLGKIIDTHYPYPNYLNPDPNYPNPRYPIPSSDSYFDYPKLVG